MEVTYKTFAWLNVLCGVFILLISLPLFLLGLFGLFMSIVNLYIGQTEAIWIGLLLSAALIFLGGFATYLGFSLSFLCSRIKITRTPQRLYFGYGFYRKSIYLADLVAWESRIPFHVRITGKKKINYGPMPISEINRLLEDLTALKLKEAEQG